uniref:Trafficking protein particle complex 8 n=1 Tax=Denticeps clupeoides TaxID=299321 RepID=A0AAY4CUL5_9TELE
MAQRTQSVQEFIQDAFVPMVAVLCSDDAEKVTRKNSLSFPELLRPFCRLTSEGHLRDPNNQLVLVKNLRISVTGVNLRPPHPAALRANLAHVVAQSQPPDTGSANVITAGEYDLNISDRSLKASVPWYSSWRNTLTELSTSNHFTATTPWFEAYRENFLQSMPASEHEFLNHYLACMLVVSSSEAVPMEEFLKLSQEQHKIQHSGEYAHPRWFIPNTLKYYVLLHDLSQGDQQRAESVYEDMKQRYGSQACYLLKINSRQGGAAADEQIPDPWSQYLNRTKRRPQTLPPGRLSWPPTSHSGRLLNLVVAASADTVSNNLADHPLQLDQAAEPTFPGDAGEPAGNAEVERLQKGGASTLNTLHGAWLTLNDHDRIRQFVQEFTFRGLLPHIEKNIRQLNDQLLSRKGLSRSLFSATKKWFGGGKVPEKSINELKNTAGLLYPPEAPELQIRKMADLCFLVQHYELAYSCYHTAKKDFLSDQAMMYAAGSLEMAAVSAFLQTAAPRPYPAHYMDTAIQTYRDVCRNMLLAERCALLSSEVLKSQAKYSEAATLLIKMTSEDSDLRSALLLEQAAHCFINMRNPMVRKFAFHMILSGHRYSKAGQRQHALRCYCQALQVYRGKGWSLAEDHINFTIGRQSFTLRQPGSAAAAFRHILVNDSQQSPVQQAAFLREYLYVYKVHSGSESVLPQLPLPYLNSARMRVFFGHERRPAEGEKQAATHVTLDQECDADLSRLWVRLEEQVVALVNRGVVPTSFQPTQACLSHTTDNLRFPLAVVEEPITVELSLRNPLKVPLLLTHMSLLWKFTAKDFSQSQSPVAGESVSNEKEALDPKVVPKNDIIATEVIPQFFMSPEETKVARLKLLPHQTGELRVLGVVYNLGTADMTNGSAEGLQAADLWVRGRQDVELQGARLNQTKEDKTSVKYGPDHRLDPIITPPMPLLEVASCGRRGWEFVNVSAVPLSGLRVVSTHPNFFTLGGSGSAHTPLSPSSSEHCSAYKTVAAPPSTVAKVTRVSEAEFRADVAGVMEVPLPGGVLGPGEALQLPMWLRGPDSEGVHEIHFLFYYETGSEILSLSHRVLRHTAVICASRSLCVRHISYAFQMCVSLHQNEAGVREFHIVQVSSSSRIWRLHTCINPTGDKDSKLANRERGKLCFRVSRSRSQDGTTHTHTHTHTHTQREFIPLFPTQIVSSSTPCADFFFRRGPAPVQAKLGVTLGQEVAPVGGADSSLGIIRKCSEIELDIIVLWKAYMVEDNKQLILEGQLHVALQRIGKEACSFTQRENQEMVLLKFKPEPPPPLARPSLEQLSHLIKTCLQYPETYQHQFLQKSICMVPVTLMLSNCSMAQVDVIIDLRHKSTSPDSLEVSGVFVWLGQTQYKLQLAAQEVRRVCLRACFTRPGVYNLGVLRVFAKLAQASSLCETSQQNALPSLIIINSA